MVNAPKTSYSAAQNKLGQWRILRSENSITYDVCGAANAQVAWEQVAILEKIASHHQKPS